MRVMAQLAMVMNLDKCIGCHTCSVTCKQAWTNRGGVEYVWFNNVETRPGQGYPRRWQDQESRRGGWVLNRRGRITLRAGGRFRKLAGIFSNPLLPEIKDYYEPWTYDYRNLTDAPLGDDFPVAQPHSLLTGKPMPVTWSANWDDDLGGAPEAGGLDPVVAALREKRAAEVSEKVRFAFEQTFMFYLPRICEHCLNPSCVASCPSGAMYKRVEDGIVLVDQDRCRGWRMCVTGCPYKKVYFNHRTGKAEKCTFCYPRVEVGLPTVCSETCVGRLRYLGVLLYDADRVLEAASVPEETDLYEAQLGVFLDPEDPAVRRAAEQAGIAHDWIEAARRSPVHALVARHRVALPLHPEYRTMPMVWYVPPLSPVVEALAETGFDGEDAGRLFAAIDALRIPVGYLAELFTAGDPGPVRAALERLAAMRAHMREVNLGREPDGSAAAAAGMTTREVEELYRLLAIAKYEERYVIPTAATADARRLEESALPEGCSLDVAGGPGMGGAAPSGTGGGPGGSGPLGEASGGPPPVAVENFHALRDRQRADAAADVTRGRVNLLNWDGRGRPAGLFPASAHRDSGDGAGTGTVEADRAHRTASGGTGGDGDHPSDGTGSR
jgi:nitrate reductase beta subunit